MVPEISEAFLQQFVSALAQSASAQTAAAAASEKVSHAMIEIAHDLRALREESDAGRVSAVAEVKHHHTIDMAAREFWWKRAFALAVVAIVIAQLLGIPIGRVIAALMNIKP